MNPNFQKLCFFRLPAVQPAQSTGAKEKNLHQTLFGLLDFPLAHESARAFRCVRGWARSRPTDAVGLGRIRRLLPGLFSAS